MSSRQIFSRVILFAFLALVGFALAMGFRYGSFMGILLAIVALGAGIYFIHILVKAKKELQEAEEMA